MGQWTVLCVDNTPYRVMQCLMCLILTRRGHYSGVVYLDQIFFKIITFAETKQVHYLVVGRKYLSLFSDQCLLTHKF